MIAAPDLRKLQNRIGYHFSDVGLLSLALTHRSFSSHNNERLEFLGDALLGVIISEKLYQQFPGVREGVLSRLRSSLVKGETLAELAREFSLGDYLNLGSGELNSGGQRRDSILADAVEALTGAIFLDGDMQQCQKMVVTWFAQRLSLLSIEQPLKDPKTELQEWLQAKKQPLPTYQVLSTEGASHQQVLTVSCQVSLLEQPAIATANSRRQAEKEAALLALNLLKQK